MWVHEREELPHGGDADLMGMLEPDEITRFSRVSGCG
jgi:hypothetical protein